MVRPGPVKVKRKNLGDLGASPKVVKRRVKLFRRKRSTALQVWFAAVLERFVGLARDQSLAEDAVRVNDVSRGTRDVGLDIQPGDAGARIAAAFEERLAVVGSGRRNVPRVRTDCGSRWPSRARCLERSGGIVLYGQVSLTPQRHNRIER